MKEYVLKVNEDNQKITVHDVHQALLPMIEEIDRVCIKHNIDYFIEGGSALGAIRHKGFIPWDDDFDIAVMYDDYPRLLKALNEDLDEGYHYQCFDTHKEYNVLIPAMKIRKKNTFIQETNSLLKNKCKDGDGLFVDVFIMDRVSNKPYIDLPFRLFNQMLMPVIAMFENININPYIIKKLFVNVARYYGRINKNSDYVGYDLTWTFRSPFRPCIFKYDSLFPLKRVPFENLMLPVPKNDDDFLNAVIGKGYMQPPPLDKQKPKHIVDIKL